MTLDVWRTFSKGPCVQEYYIEQITEIYGKTLVLGRVQETINLYRTELKDKNDREIRKNINKLSFRQRCKATPTVAELRGREKNYVNDAIITEKQRTKYKDIIPVYDASNDNHCKAYFKRPDVRRLITVTCSPLNSPRK